MAKKKALKISCVHRDTYYRAGLQITKNGVEVPLDSLTKDQVLALKADTNLRVVETSVGEEEASTGGDKDKEVK